MAAPLLESEGHTSVLLHEVTAALLQRRGGTYLDLTAGYGGHTQALLDADATARVIACDRDAEAVRACATRLLGYGDRVQVVHACFTDADRVLAELGIAEVDGLLADLGVSSPQLDTPERGMSFRAHGPLDMRMDQSRGETALELIERLSTDELADVIYQYGEERRSRRVARCIKQALEAKQLGSTSDLRRAVVRAVGPRRVGGIDPATRTFQGLRIAVNDELGQLSRLLELAPRLLRAGGVAAFIAFHSLEDRLVKRALIGSDAWAPKTKKPLLAADPEREHNPRARSAKLRVAHKLELELEFQEPGVLGDPDWT